MNPKSSILAPALIAGAAVVAAAAVGATLALSGVISRPEVIDPLTTTSIDARTANAYDCASGAVISTLNAGQRVLIVSRSAEGDWVGVRNPATTSQTLWLPRSVLTLDEGEALAQDLPISGACPSASVVVDVDVDTPLVAPDDQPEAAPAVDSVAPSLSAFAAGPTQISCMTGTPWPTNSQLSLTATDAAGVAAVDLTWSGSYTGSATMQASGTTWSFTFDASGPGDKGTVVFSAVAVDPSGNRSSPATVSVSVDCLV